MQEVKKCKPPSRYRPAPHQDDVQPWRALQRSYSNAKLKPNDDDDDDDDELYCFRQQYSHANGY
jgi:hypothetical protein